MQTSQPHLARPSLPKRTLIFIDTCPPSLNPSGIPFVQPKVETQQNFPSPSPSPSLLPVALLTLYRAKELTHTLGNTLLHLRVCGVPRSGGGVFCCCAASSLRHGADFGGGGGGGATLRHGPRHECATDLDRAMNYATDRFVDGGMDHGTGAPWTTPRMVVTLLLFTH